MFAGMHIQMHQVATQSGGQYPYRAISPLVTTSTRRFKFAQADCTAWDQFAEPLKSAPQWYSSWFRVVRRCLLYAGGKEFTAPLNQPREGSHVPLDVPKIYD